MKELIEIQTTLIAKKNQFNSFGRYSYRNTEDILESVKPLLKKYECTVILSDEIVLVGDRFYIKATAIITNGKGVTATAYGYARESLGKKGMDDSQVTGTASSYARKYALNGLLAIDDTKDEDTLNKRSKEASKVDTDSTGYKTASKASDDEKRVYWEEFKDMCQVYEVDALEFLESQVDMSDKNKVHNTTIHWLRQQELLKDQLISYAQR